jgi:prepilin-type N-terminal cleavage/methylation domain-containing protein
MISRPAGFTLIELMLVVAMIAILTVIAAPSLRDVISNARMTSAANDLLTDLSIARAEAVKRGAPTAVCTSNNGTSCTATAWSQGWIIFSDSGPDKGGTSGAVDGGLPLPDTDTVLKIVPAIDGANNVPPNTIVSANHATNAGAMWVGFRPSGVVTAGGAGADITFNICDFRTIANVGNNAALSRGRQVTVSRTGRAFVQRFTCP